MNTLTSEEHRILELFNLSDNDVNKTWYENLGGTAAVHVRLANHPFPCPDCECKEPRVKDYRIKKIEHSVLSDRKCILIYHARRYICPVCGRTYYERNPFVFKKQKISSLTVIRILEDLKSPNETFSSVAERYHVSATSVASIFDEHVNMEVRKLPNYLSVDEVYAFRSDDSKYVCVLLDYFSQEPVDILPSRQKKYLLEYFKRIPLRERNKVRMINTDLYDVYRQVFREVFPNAILSCDRFHTSQVLHRDLNNVRIRVMKRYANTAPPNNRDSCDEYYLCKHFSWIVTKRRDAYDKHGNLLFAKDRKPEYNYHFKKELNYFEIRQMIMAIDPGLAEAIDLKDKFVDFYTNATYESAPAELRELIKLFASSSVPEMNDFSRTLISWFQPIVNSFIIVDNEYSVDKSTGQVAAHPKRMNAGLIERKNGTIKLLKKGSMGYKNWDRFRNRCLYVLRKSANYHLAPIDNPKPRRKYKKRNVNKNV